MHRPWTVLGGCHGCWVLRALWDGWKLKETQLDFSTRGWTAPCGPRAGWAWTPAAAGAERSPASPCSSLVCSSYARGDVQPDPRVLPRVSGSWRPPGTWTPAQLGRDLGDPSHGQVGSSLGGPAGSPWSPCGQGLTGPAEPRLGLIGVKVCRSAFCSRGLEDRRAVGSQEARLCCGGTAAGHRPSSSREGPAGWAGAWGGGLGRGSVKMEWP